MRTLTEAPETSAARETPARRRSGRLTRIPYWLLLPCLVVIAGLLLWPLIQVFWMSFHYVGIRQLRGDRAWPWVGFDNYTEMRATRSSVRCCATP